MKLSTTVALTTFFASTLVIAKGCVKDRLYCYGDLTQQGKHNADRFINQQNREALIQDLPFEAYKDVHDFVFKCLIGGDVNLVAMAHECRDGHCSPDAVRNRFTGQREAGCLKSPDIAAQRKSDKLSIIEKFQEKKNNDRARKTTVDIPDEHFDHWWATEP